MTSLTERPGRREGERCSHCEGTGWTLDRVETTFDEFEDVYYLCSCRKDSPRKPDPFGSDTDSTDSGDTGDTSDARRERSARRLFRERAHEIEPLGGSRYLVPSRTELHKKWEVDVDANDGSGSCFCPDHTQRGVRCAHIRSAGMAMEAELCQKRRKANVRKHRTAVMMTPDEIARNVAALERMVI